jgi:hypothetical protein
MVAFSWIYPAGETPDSSIRSYSRRSIDVNGRLVNLAQHKGLNITASQASARINLIDIMDIAAIIMITI